MSKLRYLAPNGCTAFSLLLGLASIVESTQGNFKLAAWMILWGVLLDKLDGTFARLLNASSEFGAQMDSFADFVSFGMAPAALLYFGLAENPFVHHGFLIGSCGVFVVAEAARLARFNISEPPYGHMMFYGIPTTLMGALIASGYLTWDKFNLTEEYMTPVPFGLLMLALAMVSNIKLPKLKVRKNMLVNLFLGSNILFAYTMAPLQKHPEVLFGQAAFYMIFGVIL